MRRNQYYLCLILIVTLAFPSWSANYNDNNIGIDPLSILFLIGALIPPVSAINVTDEWSYQTTNAQSIIGTIGFLSMACNFVSAWYFYRKTQQDLARELQEHKNELENSHNAYRQRDMHIDDCVFQIEQYIAKKQHSRDRIAIPSDTSPRSDHDRNQ